MSNAKVKTPASVTFPRSVTRVCGESPTRILRYVCNANEKRSQWVTLYDSVTLWKQWYEKNFRKGFFGDWLDNRKVCCVHCKCEYLLRSFFAHEHYVRCETLWENKQVRLKNTRSNWRQVSVRECHRCGRTIYADRTNSHRTCWQCAKIIAKQAVERWQQRKRDERDLRRQCETCQHWFEPKRSTARYCSARCRVAAHRKANR